MLEVSTLTMLERAAEAWKISRSAAAERLIRAGAVAESEKRASEAKDEARTLLGEPGASP